MTWKKKARCLLTTFKTNELGNEIVSVHLSRSFLFFFFFPAHAAVDNGSEIIPAVPASSLRHSAAPAAAGRTVSASPAAADDDADETSAPER